MTRPRLINFAPPESWKTNRPVARQREAGDPDWYQIRNAAGVAEVYIYDEIGTWGVSAGEFVDAVKSIGPNPINLHINSGGGDVWDGVAIYNAIHAHPAAVNVMIDGIAASAASFIAQAGDTITMAKTATMMIHDAATFTYGDEAEHIANAALLGKLSDTIAGIYTDRAGGTDADWRAVMQATRWYNADEAVTAGLADDVFKPPSKAPANTAKAPVFARIPFPPATEPVPSSTPVFDAEALRNALRKAVA